MVREQGSDDQTRKHQESTDRSQATEGYTPDRQADEARNRDEGVDQRPQRIGRFRIERVLGSGGFGNVYLAHDEELDRPVAVKVPHRRLVSSRPDAAMYVGEARALARLDHPHIVSVHDVGSTDRYPFFMVSSFIDGMSLSQYAKRHQPSCFAAARLVAHVAEALHYAHKRGLVHRDIKPSNILIDSAGQPHVVDFGLALKDVELDRQLNFAGTPNYMSPEQARGEGHRVDGRSDIFSLGVVFYELLVGRRPYRASDRTELLRELESDPKPPRQFNESIPKEIERICLKSVSKRAADRYTTAHDFAEELLLFLDENPHSPSTPHLAQVLPPPDSGAESSSSATESQPLRIVPKGLRPFDEQDADFFLELLPGPRDRRGLPDSLRFWKSRIEQRDSDDTFSVGLIYGPSGCGKSSLVKAGLLPRLSTDVNAVYVESTANDTETRLLKGLRKHCPTLPAHLDLRESLAALRQGKCTPNGEKILIVIDQFEQWLHARHDPNELVAALRQCDGGRVQCILMVRDDFWLAVSRFMRELEVNLLERHNVALADLFDLDHAKRVLAAFGRAFGRLPNNAQDMSTEQKQFLKTSISGLAQEGRVICVRLALFAEMMKGHAWTLNSLKERGGTSGVGVTFLDETFSSNTASPQHRYHQRAARSVLAMLLPDASTDIKGRMRSYDELLDASGYRNRKEFDDLLEILDSEIRLITPTDPEGSEDEDSVTDGSPGQRYYQLTHDYLVHSVREWLTRKQMETRGGRARIRLADRSAVWNAKPENRNLPSWWEFWSIRLYAGRKQWTQLEQKMMSRATTYFGIRAGMVCLALLVGVTAASAVRNRLVADGLVQGLLNSDISAIPRGADELDRYRRWVEPRLVEQYDELRDDQKLRACIALVRWDGASYADGLLDQLLDDVSVSDLPTITEHLAKHLANRSDLSATLWRALESPQPDGNQQRLRAACALAILDSESERWAEPICEDIALQLVSSPANLLGQWMENLRPIREKLTSHLAAMVGSNEFRGQQLTLLHRNLAVDVLTDYADEQPDELVNAIVRTDPDQFAKLFPVLEIHGATAIERLQPWLVKQASDEAFVNHQANAALALARMGQGNVIWPLLRHTTDPRLRSYLIHRFSERDVPPEFLTRRLSSEQDVSARRAILLSLGDYSPDELSTSDWDHVLAQIKDWYKHDPDPGVHGATRWLFRQWKLPDEITVLDQQVSAESLGNPDPREGFYGWYLSGEGLTMVVITQPIRFEMGSEPDDEEGYPDEYQHTVEIPRDYEISAHEVTRSQFQRFHLEVFQQEFTNDQMFRYQTPDSPIGGINWYMAAGYCNWLSKQEGLDPDQWCYEITDISQNKVRLAPNYLQRTGYRMPTEAEWEFACRAGARTTRYYGKSLQLLPQYGWNRDNAMALTWPVGSLKPNDLGLFDMYGNVEEWCLDGLTRYPQGGTRSDVEQSLEIPTDELRITRGGSFEKQATLLRCAYRNRLHPIIVYSNNGFRVARTRQPLLKQR